MESDSKSINQTYAQWRASQLELISASYITPNGNRVRIKSNQRNKLRQPKGPIITMTCDDAHKNPYDWFRDKPVFTHENEQDSISKIHGLLPSVIGKEIDYSLIVHERKKQDCLALLQAAGFTKYEIQNNKCFYHPNSTWSYGMIKDYSMATRQLPPRKFWNNRYVDVLLYATNLLSDYKIPTKQLPEQVIHLPIINP